MLQYQLECFGILMFGNTALMLIFATQFELWLLGKTREAKEMPLDSKNIKIAIFNRPLISKIAYLSQINSNSNG